MKQKRVLLLALALTGVFALGAAASSAAQQITAALRPDITVTVDGVRQPLTSQDGASVAPISYNGTTYLPVRALSEALGKNVTWDQRTQTVILTTPDGVTGATQNTEKPAQDKPATATGDSKTFDSRITALSGRVDALENKWSWDTYRALDRDIDGLDDELESAYRAGKLTREQYRTLDDKLDRVDDRLDILEDRYDWDD